MINGESNNCHYCGVKNFSKLNYLGWLGSKKEAIINDDNDFQNALDDASNQINYQTIEIHPERISKIKPYFNWYNWEGIEFLAGAKD